MDINPFLYDNLPQPQENNDLIQEECHQYLSKLNFNKTIFRMQSPEPSIQDDCFKNENEKSFDVDFVDFNYINEEKKFSSDDEEFNQCSKKIQKVKKLKKKSKNRNGPLSEKEFTEIMKKIDQCQQIMNMIENMSMIVNRFKLQLEKQRNSTLM
ncbi:unnamed protein product [Paramecium pentaurelia]|uniref:Uncharacterized protein n=1 Tax=Paramecium pentaurelia TaxID=43138 RepID=A0A8S1TJF7_9CILI|nr:unnamed protein product [Paramecium pentaurelia]